jgi:polyisoprenoid-binding protein YceI
MNTRLLALSASAAAILLAGGTFLAVGGAGAPTPATDTPAPAPAEAKTYTIDSVHTSVIFKIRHFDTSNFYGRFNKASGSFTLGDTASIDAVVPTDSVDTNQSKRDSDIKAPEYLDAKGSPEIKLVAKSLTKSGDTYKGKADLTFHGVTKSIDIEVHQTGAGKGMGGKDIAGIETSFTIKRSDYGAKVNPKMVGDDVTIWVASEGGAK